MATSDPTSLLRRLLLEKSEQEWLEFKHNNTNPEDIGKCVSACANAAMLGSHDRAFIVWGIENRTKRRLGTTIRLEAIRKGNENLANWLGRIVEPRLVLEFLDFEDRGKLFSILSIDPAYDRPVRFAGTEYIRVGENIKQLRDFPEHERALWLATGRHKFESAVALPHQTENDVFDKLDVDAYYRLSKGARPQSPAEIIRRLCMLDFIKEDWEGGYDITNLGAILFARELGLFPSIATKSVRVIKYSARDKSQSEGETEGQKGYAVGFQGLIRYILDNLPRHEDYRDAARTITSTYSAVSIREIVANALIHQDFTISGAGPVIEIYTDRVEVINPGSQSDA